MAWRRAIADEDGKPFELILLDPPYADSDDVSAQGRVATYLHRLTRADIGGSEVTRPGVTRPLVVLHHRSTVCFDEAAVTPWAIVDTRTYGTNTIVMFA